MCIKWIKSLFNKPDPVLNTKKVALLFAINDYPGYFNDLQGCINDQNNIEVALNDLFYPEFIIKKFADQQVTVAVFTRELKNAVSALRSGDVLLIHYSGHGTYTYDESGDEQDGQDEALYLYDGMLVDDDIHDILTAIPDDAIVVIMLDSCFSGTATKAGIYGVRKKFVPNPVLQRRGRTASRIFKSSADLKWIVMSGCRDDQTSADAFIDNEYNGAFTYYAVQALYELSADDTYNTWMETIHRYLPNEIYDQYPTLEGREDLLNRKIFQ